MGIISLVPEMEKVIPNSGQISFLDRSWYTRAITEPIMGYCTENQYRAFMKKLIIGKSN